MEPLRSGKGALRMRSLTFMTAASVALFCSALFAASSEDREIPSFVKPEHADVLKRWLLLNPGYRVATDRDCRCDSDLVDTRTTSNGVWKADPTYQPYYTTGGL
jgi:hypothetical protein